MSTQKTAWGANGFTLVELLVVITIIVILISILTPSLERAMSQAERVMCLANLKGIGNGLGTYMSDSRQGYPRSPGWGLLLGQQGTEFGWENWHVDMRPLNPYLGYTVRGSSVPIARCPSDIGDPVNMSATSTSAFVTVGTSYLEAVHNYSGVREVFGKKWENGAVSDVAPARRTQLAPSSNKIVLGDTVYYGNRPLRLERTRWHQPDYVESLPPARQTRKCNVLLADFHAEYFTFDNAKIDNEVDINNAARTPNPSIGWW